MSEPASVESPSPPSPEDSRPEGPTGLAGAPPDSPRRIDLYDGLRGFAIVLVVLSHGWQLWPVDWIDTHGWVRPFFRNGNSGVSVFLVAAGFLMFRSLTSRRPLASMRPDTAFVRRVARVGPSLWLFLLVAVAVTSLDGSTAAWHADTGSSVFHVLTYTWNWYVQGNLVTSRPDFGHLWYLSVDMQAFVIMAAFCSMLRRHRIGLVFALSGFYVVLLWWRFHVAHTENIFQVLVRTTVRMDPFVLGVIAAALLPELARLPVTRQALSWLAAGSLVALVPILYWCDEDMSYLRWGGTVLEWDLVLFFVAVALGGSSTLVVRVAGNGVATWLGRNSLLLYIWHYEVFTFVSRHTRGSGWTWEGRTVVGLAATVAVCVAADRLLERRVTAWLRRPGWRTLDDGVPRWLLLQSRPIAAQMLSRVDAEPDHRDR
jgi:peptidoglycan/LPS O-acetylase OafA/YrhL